ncbi:MAG: BPSS1780 family membrane protein [Thiobacillus sp.]|nr:BPSS1780 family membrane protein [Thiobacillus sp.]
MTSASKQDIPRTVPASQGWRWVVEGFRLYRKNALLLSAAFGMLFGLVMALNLIPGIGGTLSELASPLMVAGFMAAFRALDSGEDLELPHFLAGIRRPILSGPALPLMAMGAVQLLGTLAIGQVMHSMGFDPEIIMAAAQNEKASPAELQALMNQSLPAVLTGLLLFTPLIMATWFSPALILFGGARLGTALGVSLKAVAKNWAALTVNGLVLGLMLIIAALIPMLLGLLVAMPVLFGSLYASYQAIFAVWADDTEADQAVDKLA